MVVSVNSSSSTNTAWFLRHCICQILSCLWQLLCPHVNAKQWVHEFLEELETCSNWNIYGSRIPGSCDIFENRRDPVKFHWISRIEMMALCKTAVNPLLTQWSNCSLALSHINGYTSYCLLLSIRGWDVFKGEIWRMWLYPLNHLQCTLPSAYIRVSILQIPFHAFELYSVRHISMIMHDAIMTLKYFLHYWPVVRGTTCHWWIPFTECQ